MSLALKPHPDDLTSKQADENCEHFFDLLGQLETLLTRTAAAASNLQQPRHVAYPLTAWLDSISEQVESLKNVAKTL